MADLIASRIADWAIRIWRGDKSVADELRRANDSIPPIDEDDYGSRLGESPARHVFRPGDGGPRLNRPRQDNRVEIHVPGVGAFM